MLMEFRNIFTWLKHSKYLQSSYFYDHCQISNIDWRNFETFAWLKRPLIYNYTLRSFPNFNTIVARLINEISKHSWLKYILQPLQQFLNLAITMFHDDNEISKYMYTLLQLWRSFSNLNTIATIAKISKHRDESTKYDRRFVTALKFLL